MMGFEFQKMEARRLLCLLGLLFATVLLFQCIELPKGSFVFSQSGNVDQRISSFFSETHNKTSPIIALAFENSQLTLPLENATFKNTSSVPSGQNGNFSVYDAVPPVAVSPAPLVSSAILNSSFVDNTDVKNEDMAGNFSLYVPVPPTAASPAEVFPSAVLNSSFVDNTEKEEDMGFPQGQNGNFSHYVAVPPFAASPAPLVSSVILNSSSVDNTDEKKENVALPPGQNGNFRLYVAVPPIAASPPAPILNSSFVDNTDEKEHMALPQGHNGNFSPYVTVPPAARQPKVRRVPVGKPKPKPKSELPTKEVFTLSDMNEVLIQSQVSPNTMVPRWPMKVDEQLVLARSEIENAPPPSNKDGLYAPLYHNASMFQRSYELMEEMLKVYIYKEGDRRIFHEPPLEGIYASEGWFMKLLEENRQFVTKRGEEAHLFYLPFSSRNLEEVLYVPNSHSHRNLALHLKGYVDMISALYPFWNRTYGSDHFFVACHDWAPSETKRFLGNSIRGLCNADVKEGFKLGKDVSVPETYVRKASNPERGVGGRSPRKRKTLAFFAGNMHGYLRPILLQHWGWGNKKDRDMQIYSELPRSKGNRNYIEYMKSSKYCLCPRGYEVNSPRVVEAIFYECVPVIISDNFVPPFFETLNWESFAVIVAENDIPNLKNILLSIPEKTYFRMHMRVRKVQQHFLWHPKPVKFDLFHMILHSIWFNRLFQFTPTLSF